MTAPIGMADFAATVTRPAFLPATQPTPAEPFPPLNPNPTQPRTDGDLTPEDVGLPNDLVAQAARHLTAIDELKARMSAQQLADLRQYEQTRTHLKAVA